MDIEEAKEQLLKHKKEIDEKYISARYSKAIEVVLSELEKKDKEIELLKEQNEYVINEYGDTIEQQQKEIEKNKEILYLANNELLGYAQGYEDGKKHKQTATAMVIENMQYQIIAEEIKRYRAIIEKLQKKLEKKDKIINLMAEQLTTPVHSKKWVIEYFTNKVEEDK